MIHTQDLCALPGLGKTEHVPVEEKIIRFRFFLPESPLAEIQRAPGLSSGLALVRGVELRMPLRAYQWLIAGYDLKQDMLFAYTFAENIFSGCWETVGFEELRSFSLQGVELENDLSWRPIKFGEILKSAAAKK